MATVNFSVPDEVKAEFDKAFGDQNKSSIIAELMRRAVREHGGAIEVRSQAGDGTTFTVTLPALAPRVVAEDAKQKTG